VIGRLNTKSDISDLEAILNGNKKAIENEYIQFGKLSALVIDDISAMRHAISSQLQAMGMNLINTASDAEGALKRIESNSYDLILCDYNLNRASSGQHFLEYLRLEKLLSAKTIFVMVTAEAEYAYVANAAEFGPDDYILKPCPEKKLRSRLERLFDRRTFLMPVINAIDTLQYELAVSECDSLIAKQPDERWLMHVLRLKAEAQLALHDTENVLHTYAQAVSIRDAVPWVAMGIARTHFLLKDLPAAEQSAKDIIAKNPNYVAAYELLAQIKLGQKDHEGALHMLHASSKILPSAKRFRSLSESAFLLGRLDEAKQYAESAIRLSSGSMVERSDDYLSLAQIQTDLGDHRSAILTLEKSARKYEETGVYGVAKNAILAQAYFDSGDMDKARKLIGSAQRLVTDKTESSALTALGKVAIKTGDLILGFKLLTRAVQSGGKDKEHIARHVTKAMKDCGQNDKIDDVIDAGQRRILDLVEEATKAMRVAQFTLAFQKVLEALAIHDENIEALLAAAQLHLLWLKQDGMDKVVAERAKDYLATLDRLVPKNEKVMGFYRFFNELTGV